jgi:DNA-binding XRE family transcriptional regulator
MSENSYYFLEAIGMGSNFDDLFDDIEAEAKAEGPAAVRDLRAKQLRYRLLNALISRRRDLSLTQAQLSLRSGIAQTEISRIECGRKSPTIDTYSRIAAAMDMEVPLGGRRIRRSSESGPRAVRAKAS